MQDKETGPQVTFANLGQTATHTHRHKCKLQ